MAKNYSVDASRPSRTRVPDRDNAQTLGTKLISFVLQPQIYYGCVSSYFNLFLALGARLVWLVGEQRKEWDQQAELLSFVVFFRATPQAKERL